MTLVGLPTVAALTTIEMTPNQYKEFRRQWVRAQADDMVWDGEVTVEIALLTANNDFALEEKKESPFEARNQAVRRSRRISARQNKAGRKEG